MNIRLNYIYENENGIQRISGDVILSGNLTDLEIRRVWESLAREKPLFIPSRLSLPHLSKVKNNDYDSFMMALDFASSEDEREMIDRAEHPWHEILCIDRTEDSSNCGVSSALFLDRMLFLRFKDSVED